MSVYDKMLLELLNGEKDGGSSYVENLIKTKAKSSVLSYISKIRKSALLSNDPRTLSLSYKRGIAKINAFKTTDNELSNKVKEFLSLDRYKQHIAKRKCSSGIQYFENDQLDKLLCSMEFFPPLYFKNFYAPESMVNDVLKQSDKNKKSKNLKIKTLRGYQKHIDACKDIMQQYLSGEPHSHLVLFVTLITMSGRRFGEIASGKSTFTPVKNKWACTFDGQLKKKSVDDPDSYIIPLLCDPTLFVAVYKKLIDSIGIDEPQVREQKYNHNTNAHVKKMLNNNDVTCHDIRRAYLSATYQAFEYDEQYSLSYYIQLAAGHTTPTTSLSYTHLRVTGVDSIPEHLRPVLR